MGDTGGCLSPLFDLLDLGIRYPIAKRIYHFLSITDIVSLTRTCRKLGDLYKSLLLSEWNVDRTLSRFVSDPRRFRSLMAKHNAFVAGTVPLQFFERVVRKDQHLSVYLEPRPGLDGVGNLPCPFTAYLINLEGYKAKSGDYDRCCDHHIYSVRTMVKRHIMTNEETTIRIHATTDFSIQTIIECSRSNVEANFFSWNKAFSLFPLTTFTHRHAFINSSLSIDIEETAQEYEERGWNARNIDWPVLSDVAINHYPLCFTRRIGDRSTWIIPFDTTGVDSSGALPDLVLEHATFSADISPHDDDNPSALRRCEFTANAQKFGVLRYRYTFGRDGWRHWLSKIMTYKALEQLHAMAFEDRPENFESLVTYAENIRHHYLPFQKPAYWSYCDDEIPSLYEAWKITYSHTG